MWWWPPGLLERLLELGIIGEGERRDCLLLWECDDLPYVEPEWIDDIRTGKPVGIVGCPTCRCAHTIDPDRMRTWIVSFTGLAQALARALGTSGSIVVDVPDRVCLIGSVLRDGVYRELFLMRGVTWPDAANVIRRSQRLARSPAPAVLVLDDLPEAAVWQGQQPAVASLPELVSMTPDRLEIDLMPLLGQVTGAALGNVSPWITVTEAAELHMADVDDLDLEKAKARVSVAASRGQFKTNQRAGVHRRIERVSFNAWRLEQRERNLSRADDA